MIVISGALVLVALVLLVIGLVSSALGFVYASIAVSVVSFIFLIIGIMQRRGEELPGVGTAPVTGPAASEAAGAGDLEGVTAIVPAVPSSTAPTEALTVGQAAPDSRRVLVVTGRPRYHVAGCRYLTGKSAADVPMTEAREQGFTACGVCRPDDAAVVTEAVSGIDPAPAPVSEPSVAEPALAERASTTTRPSRTARKVAAAPTKAPVKAPIKTPAKSPAKSPAKTLAQAPAQAPAKAPAKAAVRSTGVKTPARRPAAVAAPETAAPMRVAAKPPGRPAKATAAAPAKKAAPVKASKAPAKKAATKAAPPRR